MELGMGLRFGKYGDKQGQQRRRLRRIFVLLLIEGAVQVIAFLSQYTSGRTEGQKMIRHFPQMHSRWQAWRWALVTVFWLGIFLNQRARAQSTPNANTHDIDNIIYVDGVVYPQTGAGIQSALNALGARGGTVILPCASYTVNSTIIYPSNASGGSFGPQYIIEGAAPNCVVLAAGSSLRGYFLDTANSSNAANLGIENVEFTSPLTQALEGIHIDNVGFFFSQNVWFIHVNGYAYQVEPTGGSTVRIENGRVEGGGTANSAFINDLGDWVVLRDDVQANTGKPNLIGSSSVNPFSLFVENFHSFESADMLFDINQIFATATFIHVNDEFNNVNRTHNFGIQAESTISYPSGQIYIYDWASAGDPDVSTYKTVNNLNSNPVVAFQTFQTIGTPQGIAIGSGAAITSSGAGGKMASVGANGVSAGTVTLSAGSGSHSFPSAYTSSSAPVCTATDSTSANAVKITVSGSAGTWAGISLVGTGSDVIAWVCSPSAN